MDDYLDLMEYMDTSGYPKINGCKFYEDIFPACEEAGKLHTDFSHPNAVFLYHDNERDRLRRRIMLKDTWEEDFCEYIEKSKLALCSGLTYRGRANRLEKAQQMNALIFDLDGVGVEEFKILEARWGMKGGECRAVPKPTYTVLSGSGLHLYYVFFEPIALFPNIKLQLKALKYDLTFTIWDYGETSKEESVQYQSINQSFRMPGSLNTKNEHETQVVAFRTGERVDLDYLNRFVVEPGNKVDIEKPFKPTKITKKEAQELYPEWYERVIVKREKKAKKWAIDEKVHGEDPYALYHWWIGKSDNVKNGKKPDIKKRIKGGHRYYFLMCMAIFASKCNVPREKLKADMKEIFEEIAKIPHKNELTQADMAAALEAYSKEYYDTSIVEINYWTGVEIEKNKRNGRSQARHLAIARMDKEHLKETGTLKNPEGRPAGKSKERDKVREYRLEHPDAGPTDCIRDTGISRNTVYRWWKK